MIEKDLFYKIASINFHVFEIVTEEDVALMFKSLPDKEKLRDIINHKLIINIFDLPDKTTL